MTLTVSLSAEMAEFIENQVSAGTYASTAEVLSEALALLKARDLDRAALSIGLQAAWHDGMESGDFAPLDFVNLKAQGRARLAGTS